MEMWMSSSENEQEDETLGPFFDKYYSNLLNFLPHKDVTTMSILNQKWSQRVEAHQIWSDLLDSVKQLNTNKKITKKIPNKNQKQEIIKTQNQGVVKIDKPKMSKFKFWLIYYIWVDLLYITL
jgi:hypothetical protein